MQFVLKLPLASALPQVEAGESFWGSLRYFNLYRIAVGGLFLLVVLFYGDTLNLGAHNLRLFVFASAIYLGAALVFHVVLSKWPAHFNAQLTLHVLADIAALTLLMNASAGVRSGLGVMLFISLAGAALVSRGTLMLFYAALASIAVLLEQSYWVLVYDFSTANFVQPGLMSIGYFATALITNRLARRVIMNERVARQRGEDLANQLRVNQLVIQDVQDGVLVVDSNGLVHQHNRQVKALLGHPAPELDQVDKYSEELAAHLAAWRSRAGPAQVSLRFPDSGKLVRVRFVDAGIAGGSFALVFLEDLSTVQEQAQQLKLAALGRLTANIAHEIRNPLSAVTHAADLLREESQGASRDRLVAIIRDNAQRLDLMVRDVLQLSRRDRVQTETIRLRGFLAGFIDEFAQNEGIARDAFVVDGLEDPAVAFDRAHLIQVLWNLMRNAWRHCRKQTGSVRVRVLDRSNRIELHVIDDGPGVAKALQAQLFEPFFTTFSGGTGLGLYIARELCAANGTSLDYFDRSEGADFGSLW
ncbi:MAG: HAMP domain-containing histidine kinase [Betaproteobacteria bacterium]|nr:HAMP domain-containing histidine kinase [Betaproteobacteria bacterium]